MPFSAFFLNTIEEEQGNEQQQQKKNNKTSSISTLTLHFLFLFMLLSSSQFHHEYDVGQSGNMLLTNKKKNQERDEKTVDKTKNSIFKRTK